MDHEPRNLSSVPHSGKGVVIINAICTDVYFVLDCFIRY